MSSYDNPTNVTVADITLEPSHRHESCVPLLLRMQNAAGVRGRSSTGQRERSPVGEAAGTETVDIGRCALDFAGADNEGRDDALQEMRDSPPRSASSILHPFLLCEWQGLTCT